MAPFFEMSEVIRSQGRQQRVYGYQGEVQKSTRTQQKRHTQEPNSFGEDSAATDHEYYAEDAGFPRKVRPSQSDAVLIDIMCGEMYSERA